MVAYVWPRLDFNVTKATNHLIKTPYVAHPKSGRIAVPIDPFDYFFFDPSKAPSLKDLSEEWDKLTDIESFITKPTPEEEREAPKRSKKRERKPRV